MSPERSNGPPSGDPGPRQDTDRRLEFTSNLSDFAAAHNLEVYPNLISNGPPPTIKAADLEAILSGRLHDELVKVKSDWKSLRRLVHDLKELRKDTSGEFIASVLSKPDKRGTTILHGLCARDAPAPLIATVAELGADVNALSPVFTVKDEDRRLLGNWPPLLVAMGRGNLETALVLARRGAMVEAGDSESREKAYAGVAQRLFNDLTSRNWKEFKEDLAKLDELEQYIGDQATGLVLTAQIGGLNLLHKAVVRAAPMAVVESLLSRGLSFQSDLEGVAGEQDKQTFELMRRDGSTEQVPIGELLRQLGLEMRRSKFFKLANEYDPYGDKTIIGEMEDLVRQNYNPVHLQWYALAFLEAVDKKYLESVDPLRGQGAGLAMAKLLPHLLYTYESKSAEALIRATEKFFDIDEAGAEKFIGWHPHVPEMMALLGHPRLGPRTWQSVGYLTEGITSVTRFIRNQVRIGSHKVWNWTRIGTIGHSFRSFRFDAVRFQTLEEQLDGAPKRSLLERSGFRRVGPRSTDTKMEDGKEVPLYGPGYVLPAGTLQFQFEFQVGKNETERRNFDQGFHMELRRAYILLSHPEHGTLVIRNSSPRFGRASMEHGAYWNKEGLDGGWYVEDDLLEFDGEMLKNEFTPIIDVEINTGPDILKLDSHVSFLLDHFYAWKGHYGSWKYATSDADAWMASPDGQGPRHLVGGHLSDGFKWVVEMLASQSRLANQPGGETVIVPEMAFAHPFYPPWRPYEFTDVNGDRHNQLEMTKDTLDALQIIAGGEDVGLGEQHFQVGSIRAFFQQAGLNKKGELILVTPRSITRN